MRNCGWNSNVQLRVEQQLHRNSRCIAIRSEIYPSKVEGP